MTITSFNFLAFLFIGVIIYYLLPKKVQWMELLAISLIFYYLAATPYTIVYLVISAITAYFATLIMTWQRRIKPNKQTIANAALIISISVNLILWFVFKGKGLWAPVAERLISHFYIGKIDTLINTEFIAALGMGYYTLQIIGYIIDCYWENIEVQENPFKLFLFTSYFPQLTTGPISRYGDLESIYLGHKFKYKNIAFGAQRILWGFVKKIVLAERIGVLISAILAAPESYIGFYSWIVILLYPIQMYADFSGCMDIVLGASELFGVQLAENFNNPFFARTSQEFWQRWHITLGIWAKDYVLFPILKSKPMIRFGRFTKKHFGKCTGKFLVNFVGMFFLWMVMGIWHGGWRYIVGVSLWYWIILMSGELLSPYFKKITERLKMKTESFSWHLFQSIRTYVIYAIGATFFHVGFFSGLSLLKDALKVFIVKNCANPWIFFNESILDLGVTYGDLNIIFITVILLLIVGILREKYGYARLWIARQSFVFRWLIWILLFVFVIIWGKYGPGYDASLFIYQGF